MTKHLVKIMAPDKEICDEACRKKMEQRVKKYQPKKGWVSKLAVWLISLLPVKVLRTYITLSFIGMISKINDNKLHVVVNNPQIKKNVESLLKTTYNHDTVLLPYATFELFWPNDILTKEVYTYDGTYRLIDLLSDRQLFISHRTLIIRVLFESLPTKYKQKLNIWNPETKSVKVNKDYLFMKKMFLVNYFDLFRYA